LFFFFPPPPPPPPAVAVEISRQSCRNLKSKKTEGGEYNQFVEVSVNNISVWILFKNTPSALDPTLKQGRVKTSKIVSVRKKARERFKAF
jgi:hypothetical protein